MDYYDYSQSKWSTIVTRVLEATPGVASSQVDLAGKSALVTYDPALTSVETLVTRITNAGFEARPAG